MPKNRPRKAIAKSKVIHQIYVLGVNERGYYAGPRYCKAHLRNKRGYVYLQWKDAGQVKSMYLGKAPRSSPTVSDQVQLAGGSAQPLSGRVRKSRKVRHSRQGTHR